MLMGFDSISLTEFANALNDQYDLSLTPAVFFEHECLNQLADWLAEAHGSAFPIREDRPGPVEQLPELSPEVPEPPLMDACESQKRANCNCRSGWDLTGLQRCS